MQTTRNKIEMHRDAINNIEFISFAHIAMHKWSSLLSES